VSRIFWICLLVSTVALVAAGKCVDALADINAGQQQGSQRQERGGVSGSANMVAAFPPLSGPSDTSNKPAFIFLKSIAAATLCCIFMWFGTPVLFIGIDQRSFPLFIVGIFAVAAASVTISYIIDLWFL